MKVCIKARLAIALERFGHAEKLTKVASLLSRYVCRLTTAREYRKEVKDLLKGDEEVQKELLDLKEDLDYSTIKNALYRAVHLLSTYVKPMRKTIISAADRYGIDCEDLYLFYKSLSFDDLALICAKEVSEQEISSDEILEIFAKINKTINTTIYRRLSFVLSNDPAIEHAKDLISQLHLSALRAIREYEVYGAMDRDHLIASTVNSVKNYAVNLAASNGREKRQLVTRIHEAVKGRTAYHLNIQTDEICEVHVFPDPELRKLQNGNILVLVQRTDSEDEEWFVVHYKRLYESAAEAEEALRRHKCGLRSKRKHYLDLSAQEIDDFRLSMYSIEYMDEQASDDQLLFYETYEADCENSQEVDGSLRVRNLAELGPACNTLVEYVFSSMIDELFDGWCQTEHNVDSASLTSIQYGKALRDYLELAKSELIQEIADSPASMWNQEQQRLIFKHLSRVEG